MIASDGTELRISKYIGSCLAPFDNSTLDSLVIRSFRHMYSLRAHDSCMSISASLAVGMKYLGYDAKLVVGELQDESGEEYDHAWVTLNKRIFDIAGYGNSNWSPYYYGFKWKYPIVNQAVDTLPFEYKEVTCNNSASDFVFKRFLSRSIAEYFDSNPNGSEICWDVTCSYLQIPSTPASFRELRKLADKMIIGVSM